MATKQQKQQQQQKQQIRKSSLDLGEPPKHHILERTTSVAKPVEHYSAAAPLETSDVPPENLPGPEDQTVAVSANKVDTLPAPKPLTMVADEFEPRSETRVKDSNRRSR